MWSRCLCDLQNKIQLHLPMKTVIINGLQCFIIMCSNYGRKRPEGAVWSVIDSLCLVCLGFVFVSRVFVSLASCLSSRLHVLPAFGTMCDYLFSMQTRNLKTESPKWSPKWRRLPWVSDCIGTLMFHSCILCPVFCVLCALCSVRSSIDITGSLLCLADLFQLDTEGVEAWFKSFQNGKFQEEYKVQVLSHTTVA
jgi:hypothetical protein